MKSISDESVTVTAAGKLQTYAPRVSNAPCTVPTPDRIHVENRVESNIVSDAEQQLKSKLQISPDRELTTI